MRRKVLVALGWAWVGAIVWLSLTPSPPKVDFAQSDKLGHFLAYGSLTLWFCFLYASTKARIGYAAGFIAMGIGLFAPPLGLGLYGACLIGNVPIEQTVKPILGYLGLLLLCLLVIAFVPGISTALPRAFGY